MNLKKTLAGIAAGFALIGSLVTPAAIAAPIGGTSYANATVDITDGGVFDAFFCDGFTLIQQTAPTAGTFDGEAISSGDGYAEGQLSLCYLDTKTYRGGFKVAITTGNFTSTTTSTIITPGNAKVVKTHNVGQLQHGVTSTGIDIGDIGHFVNNSYPSSQATAAWTSNNTLDEARTVGFGWPGLGTIGSKGFVDIGLTIPAGTQAGIYTSQFVMTITAGMTP